MKRFCESFWGQSLRRRIRILPYERLLKARRIPIGSYIFADIERLTPQDSERAALVWQALVQKLPPGCVLNHPTQSMRRFQLLRTMYEESINQFNVYRLTEVRHPQQYPVFIRGENDHSGAVSGLLNSAEALQAELSKMKEQGKSWQDKIITEFVGTKDPLGITRKYSAVVIGEQIIPRHIFFSDKTWMVKSPQLIAPQFVEEEVAYFNHHPHESQLRRIFDLAKINFGRIDYGCLDGKVQVWEINTNPMTLGPDGNPGLQDPREVIHRLFAERMINALEQFDVSSALLRGQVSIPPPPSGLYAFADEFSRNQLPYDWRVFALKQYRRLRSPKSTSNPQ
jgi:hypothetical protein